MKQSHFAKLTLIAMIAALALAVPAAVAYPIDDTAYSYSGYPGGGRSYQSYSRTYDTTRSDIASRTGGSSASAASNYNNQFNNQFNSQYGPYPWSDGYWYNPYAGYPYDGYPRSGSSSGSSSGNAGSSASTSYNDNYNRQYTERTNEAIKVDRYVSYDDGGLVHRIAGGAYQRRPYFYDYETGGDPYTYRYPYSTYSSGDRGFYPQTYYTTSPVPSTSAIGGIVVVPQSQPNDRTVTVISNPVPPITRYAPILQYTRPDHFVYQGDGPSQTYSNAITDRGPLYAPILPPAKTDMESAGAARNTPSITLVNYPAVRDSTYYQVYGTGRQ